MKWHNEYHKSLDSTQSYLKNRISEQDLQEGFCVSTNNQTNGYGRHGRDWKSSNGNLFFSFLIKPNASTQNIAQLSLIAGLALQKTIKPFTKNVIIKWPNDILIEDKKCAGILIEMQDNKALIGIGVNLKSTPEETFTFLEKNSKEEINSDSFLRNFQHHFSSIYQTWEEQGFETIREEWLKTTYDVGQPISVRIGENKITGTFETIDTQGNLVLICDKTNQRKTITSGDVFPIEKE